MKIRTITTGFNLRLPFDEEQFKRVAVFTLRAKKYFEKSGFVVQTVRVATQPWEEYFESAEQIVLLAEKLEKLSKEYGIDYFSMGTARRSESIWLSYEIIKNSRLGFCTSTLCDGSSVNLDAVRETAKLIKKLSTIDPDGFANLRFAALFNVDANTPFFPASYHKGDISFAIGTENSDVVMEAFSEAGSIDRAGGILKQRLEALYRRIEKVAKRISIDEGIHYGGIDLSMAPSVEKRESIAYAFERLGLGRFGESGTLSVAKLITDVLRDIGVKGCGYSGLMLPVLEDYGLAERCAEHSETVPDFV